MNNCIFMTIYHSVTMRNISCKSCRGNQNTHFMFDHSPLPLPPPSENHAVYETMWKNIVEADRPQMTIRRMRIACWITKAKNTDSEYEILIAFPQQYFRIRASMLRHTCIACLVQVCLEVFYLLLYCIASSLLRYPYVHYV